MPRDGRPTKLQPEAIKVLLSALEAGNYIEAAARYAGLSKTVVYNWIAAGARRPEGKYHEFLNAVKKAQANAEVRDVALIQKAATVQWQAAAWMLERKFPAKWGQRVKLYVREELDAALERLAKGLTPDEYAKVLRILAGGVGSPAVGDAPDEADARQESTDVH